MALYPEYQQVQAFVDHTKDLFATNMTIQDIFEMSFKANDYKTVFIYLNDKKRVERLSYADTRSKIYNIASKLHKFLYAIPKGKIVGLKLRTSPLWILFYYAILMCGYKPLLLDPKHDVNQTIKIIKEADAVALISNDNFNYQFLNMNVEEILDQRSDYSFMESWENEIIFTTSGTTGEPKLVVFDGNALCHQINAALILPERSKDIIYPPTMGELKVLCMLPFYHIFGFMANFLWYTFFNKTLVFPYSLAPNDIYSIAQRQKVTHIYSVPLFWDNIARAAYRSSALEGPNHLDTLNKLVLYNTGRISKADAGNAAYRFTLTNLQNKILGTSIRFAITGGSFIYQKTLHMINGLNYPLHNGYGMTEIGVTSVETSDDVFKRLKGSIGKPLYGVEYKILPINIEGAKKKDDSVGELLVRSPFLHVKTIEDGKEIPAILDEEGYYHTGDLAKIDKTGRYYIKGRVKELIISPSGENIYPEEIEEKFHDIENIANLCVVGVKKSSSDVEDVALVIEVNANIDDALFSKVKKDILERNKSIGLKYRVNKIFVYRDKLPISSNRKVKRYEIKNLLENKDRRFVNINRDEEPLNYEGYDENKVKQVLIKMRQIFSKVLLLPVYKLSDDGHWIDDFGGDSMSYIALVHEIEDNFHIEFEDENYGKFTCIRDFTLYLLKKNKF